MGVNMSRFTLQSLRNTRIRLVSKFDPAIDWEAMSAQGIDFDDYDARKHSDKVVVLPDMKALAFWCHSPTVRERITAFQQAGIEVDSESGVQYIGAGATSALYAPGNGALVGLTLACKCLAYLVIDSIDSVTVTPFKQVNKYGLKQVTQAALESIAPVVNHEVSIDDLDPLLIEIGGCFLNEDSETGN